MGKYNSLLNLEDKLTDVAKNIARTRGKTVWKTDWNKNQDIDLPVLDRGSSIKIDTFVEHMKTGAKKVNSCSLKCF